MSSPGEIQVSGLGGISATISRAAAVLEKTGEVVLSAINSGIPNAVQAAELLKHRVKGLYQVNDMGKMEGSNKTRVHIVLSLKQLDITSKGYQAPIADSEVTVTSLVDLQTRPTPVRRPPGEESKEGAVGTSRPPRGAGRRGRRRGGRGMRGVTRGGAREPRGTSKEPRPAAADRPRRQTKQSREPRVDENKYRKVRTTTDPIPVIPGELHITPRKPAKLYLKEAVLWFKKEGKDKLLLKGSGWALAQTVEAAETIKRAVKGLYQVTVFGKVLIVDRFEPIETGLDPVTKERTVPTIEITLSVSPLNSSDPGYQAPLQDSFVKELSLADLE